MDAMRQSTGEQTNSQVAKRSKGLWLLLLDALIVLITQLATLWSRLKLWA